MLAWSEIVAEAPSGTLGAGAEMVADSSTSSALVFGGANSQGLSNATLSYSESTNAWTNVRSTNAPSPRSDFAFGFDASTGDAVLFGGLLNLTSESVSSTTWTYNITEETWTNVSQAGPAPRENPAFAIDPALGIGLLYGGENPNYQSVGTLTYSDLWELDLSSFAWTQIKVTSGPRPPPLEGAALTWDPLNGQFEMFGGCAPCSNTVWEFDPVSEEWSELGVPSNAPAPTSGSSWTYDPLLGADLLFGGTDGTTADNETAIFYPGNDTWIPQTLPGPGARWSAASAYLNVTGNATWLVAGGATLAGPTFDLWRLSPTSDLSLRVENASAPNLPVAGANVTLNGQTLGFTNGEGYLNLTQIDGVDSRLWVDAYTYFANDSILWLPPGSSNQRTVLLTVIPVSERGTVRVTVDEAGGAPIIGADVNLTVNGTRVNSQAETTGATGMVDFSRVVPGTLNVSASATGWRANSAGGTLALAGTANITVQLSLAPILSVNVSGLLPSLLTVPLQGVTVSLNGVKLGMTNTTGTLAEPTDAFGPCNVSGDVAGYRSATVAVVVPWTGTVNASLQLVSLPAGGIDARVLNGSNGQPLFGAEVDVYSYVPLPSGWYDVTLDTNVTGWANYTSLLQGYYEVIASAGGYAPSVPVFEHLLSGETTSLTFVLFLYPAAEIALRVQSATNGTPIAGANVSLAGYAIEQTDSFGFANLSQVPAGTYMVTASATGYLTNRTVLTFTPLEIATIPINLTPAIPPKENHQSAASPFSLLPASSLWELLLLVPAVLAVGGALYSLAVRGIAVEEDYGSGAAEERSVFRTPPPRTPS